eukprot:CAMPEP_0114299714 /NCGR_PEP_ID=MMETSP0059-20121206/13128_1 /TAXON_ID=36894 /ORGANISM="Pyramimonas parkeae, Strain CCMP726" /LENGTH=45 /DNA_ID= /DNA_START= /DNA_END= /DNA_ORIENTATION=
MRGGGAQLQRHVPERPERAGVLRGRVELGGGVGTEQRMQPAARRR